MRLSMLAGAGALALWAGSASAAEFLYNGSSPGQGSVQTFSVQQDGEYDVAATGGSGGGLGATIGGRVFLAQGTVLDIFVAGAATGSGGGGGTFVLFAGTTNALIVAGGGAGGVGGENASGTAVAGDGRGGAGGVEGLGSAVNFPGGGGGAGLLSDGGSSTVSSGTGGASPRNGAAGGSGVSLFTRVVNYGGYGGGGGGGSIGFGGGGGYTGGNGGGTNGDSGAGTSYLIASAINRVGGTARVAGSGSFSINLVPATMTPSVPEPASWVMIIGGFGLVGGVMRRRRLSVSYG